MEIAQGEFTRVSPASFAQRAELPMGWVVLRHSHLPEKHLRRATHGKWVAIICGNRKIFRILRYSVNLPNDNIVLDWAGWIDLQGRIADGPDCMNLKIRKPEWWEKFIIPLFHIDPGYRMSAWLGYLSVLLGFFSLLLAFFI